MKNATFFKQADLLLRLLPSVNEDKDFALHGGTAINFFVRDLPRLSVDIDLTYLPIESRNKTLENITKKLGEMAGRFRVAFPGIRVDEKMENSGHVLKLIVNYEKALVKIEPNPIIRGSVFLVEERDLVRRAEQEFEKFVSVRTLPVHALYGGKICAALDRQHPRDLFDIKLLLENEGFSAEIQKAFLVYLISSNRPMNELLNPTLKNERKIFEIEFLGMSFIPVNYEDLEKVRAQLIQLIMEGLTNDDRKFLLSFKEGKPDWSLLDVKEADKLPAIQWKLVNLAKMDRKKHTEAILALKRVLKL